jgi:hypothetical protein
MKTILPRDASLSTMSNNDTSIHDATRLPRLVLNSLRSSPPRIASINPNSGANQAGLSPITANELRSTDDTDCQEGLVPCASHRSSTSRRSSAFDSDPCVGPHSLSLTASSPCSSRGASSPERSVMLPQLPELTRSTSTVDPAATIHVLGRQRTSSGPPFLYLHPRDPPCNASGVTYLRL